MRKFVVSPFRIWSCGGASDLERSNGCSWIPLLGRLGRLTVLTTRDASKWAASAWSIPDSDFDRPGNRGDIYAIAYELS